MDGHEIWMGEVITEGVGMINNVERGRVQIDKCVAGIWPKLREFAHHGQRLLGTVPRDAVDGRDAAARIPFQLQKPSQHR
jgi:hypothetical protein